MSPGNDERRPGGGGDTSNEAAPTVPAAGDNVRRATPIPVVVGALSDDGRSVTITCPFCSLQHVHGSVGLGSRQSHCVDGAKPYRVLAKLGATT